MFLIAASVPRAPPSPSSYQLHLLFSLSLNCCDRKHVTVIISTRIYLRSPSLFNRPTSLYCYVHTYTSANVISYVSDFRSRVLRYIIRWFPDASIAPLRIHLNCHPLTSGGSLRSRELELGLGLVSGWCFLLPQVLSPQPSAAGGVRCGASHTGSLHFIAQVNWSQTDLAIGTCLPPRTVHVQAAGRCVRFGSTGHARPAGACETRRDRVVAEI